MKNRVSYTMGWHPGRCASISTGKRFDELLRTASVSLVEGNRVGIAPYHWQHRIAVALAAVLLNSFLITRVQAQTHPQQYVATVWQTEEGLPQNSVNALLQDHNGYLWIGTYGGLARFDGERFKFFGSADLSGLGGLGITSLYESPSGVLWVGTTGGGLARMDHGVVTTYTERDGLPSRFIDSIRGDAEGNVWIKTSKGLARFAGARLEPYPTHRGKAVQEFYLQARDGSMWFRSGQEVLRFGADGSIATLNVHKPSVFLVHEAGDGSVWIAARDVYRLFRYYHGAFSEVPLPSVGRHALAGLHREFAVTMAEDANGELLLFTPAGLVRTVGGRLSSVEVLPLPSYGGILPKVRSLLEDREGDLWVGTIGSGLVRLRPTPLTAYGKDEGLSDSSFNAVFQDREGRIWLGGDSLYWFDGQRFHLVPGVADTTAIAQTRDGDLWFGGYGQLYRWRSGTLTRFQVEGYFVSGIYQDREGTLWIGAAKGNRRGGLYRFREGKLDRIPGISGVQDMTGDWNGGFLAMADEGLFHVRGGKITISDRYQGPLRDVAHFYQDSTGTLWFATVDGGLSRLRDGRLKAIAIKGLSNKVLLCFLDDGRGSLWVSSHHNIFRLSLKDLNDFADGRLSFILPVSYGVAEGMKSSDCNQGYPGVWKTTDGRIWFPTVRGVVAIDPNAGNHLPPPVVLEEAWANKFALARNRQTSVPAGNNTLDFRFTALSLCAPEKVRFKYRLEPFDKDWVDAGTRRTAQYMNMAPGEYSFHVIAANSYGVWNDHGASVSFVLRPHFYQTVWFRLLLLASMLLFAYSAHRLRIRRLQARATQYKRLADTLQEQANLLNLTHDTIFVTDMEGVAKYWNRGAEEQYGWTAEQAVGRNVHDLLKTVFPAQLEQIKAEVMRTGRWEDDLVHTRKNGTQVVVASRWSLQRDERGEPTAILETNNDITDRKQAEEALRRLNRELRAISNCNLTLLRATDEQSLLKEVCRIVCEEVGYRMAWVAYAEHNAAKSVRHVAWTGAEEGYLTSLGLTWADTERGWGPTGTAIRSGETCCIQDFTTDARFAPWRESALLRDFRSGIALPLKNEHGNAFGSLSIYSAESNAFTSEEIRLLEELAADLAFGIVSLRSRVARERVEQEVARLNFALDKVREAAFLVDDKGRFHYVNEEACRVLGYSRMELLALGVWDINPEFPAERWPDHWRDLQAQQSLTFESRHRTRDGRIFPVEISANYFEYGGRAYTLALARDITDRKRAEEALRKSEAYLVEGQRLTHTGSFAWSAVTLQTTYWSEEQFRIFGLNPKEGVPSAEKFWQRIHPEDLDRTRDLLLTAADKSMEYEHEHRIVLPDGTVKHIHAIGHPVLDENGQFAGYVGTTVDVTERKRAEEERRQSAERFRAIADYTYDWENWFGVDGKLLWVNPAVERITGYSVGECLAMPDFPIPIVANSDREAFAQQMREAIQGLSKNDFEFRVCHKDDRPVWVAASWQPIYDSRGARLGYRSSIRDIADRKRAEDALRQSEAYLAEAQRLSHTGSWAFDVASNKYIYASEECLRIFELDPQQDLPTREAISRQIHPEDWDRVNASFEKSLREKVDASSEFRITLPSGTAKHLQVTRHPVLNDAGDVVKLLGTAIDVTDRKRAEEERERLHQLEADLAQINRVGMLGELSASIAHEVNQPLSGVVSNASACLRFLAGEAPNVEEAREAARDIVRDGKRAGEIVARIRALTKRAATPREKLDLNETIREVLALIGDEARKKSVRVQTQFADDLSPVAGDRVQLQQVVLNLVMNAIEAMSSVEERARELVITTRDVDSDQVQVTVEDTGTGLDPNTIGKIFDSFYTTKPGGMGMGLSISRSILQAHGGRLWATANDGSGTSFHFTLPRYLGEESTAGV